MTFFFPYSTKEIKQKSTDLEIINVSFFSENPSIWSSIKNYLCSVNDIVIKFSFIFCKLLRHVIFLLCEFFEIY